MSSSMASSTKSLRALFVVFALLSVASWTIAEATIPVLDAAVNLTIGWSGSASDFSAIDPLLDLLNIKRSDFPVDFNFGVATSAAQTEGSGNEEGRRPSVWDHRVATPIYKTVDADKFTNAIDSYKRYKEDIEIIKNIGVDSYRFSISWSRILPNGSLSGGINKEGVDYYNRLIDKLVKNGIKPFATILHFDLPQALQDKYDGYLSREFVRDFRHYSELCFKLFGDRVKHWFTINEPWVPAVYGHELGIAPPGRCSLEPGQCVYGTPENCFVPVGPCMFGGNSSTEPYIVAHNLILAHASAAKLYKKKYQAKQKGEIGIVISTQYYKPYSEYEEDKAAAGRLMDFNLGWFLEPLVYGDYPKSMRKLVKERLPIFSPKEKRLIKGSSDFVGINYYASAFARYMAPPQELRYSKELLANDTVVSKDGGYIGPDPSSGEWPEGLQKLMEYVKDKYENPKIYISENGRSTRRNESLSLAEQLNDPERISYIARHLYRLNKAIKNGVRVQGYFYWSLFDDFEWGMGFLERFGLYHVDLHQNYKRIPKLSAKWFKAFLQS